MVNISWARSAIMTGALSVARAWREGGMSFVWYFDIRPHRMRIACPNSAVSPLLLWTLDTAQQKLWTLDTACPNSASLSQLLTTLYTGEEALLEKRP